MRFFGGQKKLGTRGDDYYKWSYVGIYSLLQMAENKRVSMRFFVSAPRSGITFILVIIGDEVGKGFFYLFLNLQTIWHGSMALCHVFCSVPCVWNLFFWGDVGDTDGTTNWLNEMGLDVATMMRLGGFFSKTSELW